MDMKKLIVVLLLMPAISYSADQTQLSKPAVTPHDQQQEDKERKASQALLDMCADGQLKFDMAQLTKTNGNNGYCYSVAKRAIRRQEVAVVKEIVALAPDVVHARDKEKGISLLLYTIDPWECDQRFLDSLCEKHRPLNKDFAMSNVGKYAQYHRDDSRAETWSHNQMPAKNEAIMRALVGAKANVNVGRKDYHQTNPLMHCAKTYHNAAYIHLLATHGADINIRLLEKTAVDHAVDQINMRSLGALLLHDPHLTEEEYKKFYNRLQAAEKSEVEDEAFQPKITKSLEREGVEQELDRIYRAKLLLDRHRLGKYQKPLLLYLPRTLVKEILLYDYPLMDTHPVSKELL